eukprot:4662912-Prymnesium_polylepis.1
MLRLAVARGSHPGAPRGPYSAIHCFSCGFGHHVAGTIRTQAAAVSAVSRPLRCRTLSLIHI